LTFDTQGNDGLPLVVGLFGLMITFFGALMTFGMFAAQVGIFRRSAAISGGVRQCAIGIAVCVAALVGIGLLYVFGSGVLSPPGPFRGPAAHEGFFFLTLGLLFPIAFGVVLFLYHRLLAAGRRALDGEAAGRYEG
jgi:hypothetical protein